MKNPVHITTANAKTGIPSFNTLAGDQTHAYDGLTPSTENAATRIKAALNAAAIPDTWTPCGTCGTFDGCGKCDCAGCYAKRMTRNIEPYYCFAVNTFYAMHRPEYVEKAVNAYCAINEDPRQRRFFQS